MEGCVSPAHFMNVFLVPHWDAATLSLNGAGVIVPVMKSTSIMSNLHLKFAEKTWSETFQLVRRCMDKSRDESKPCEPLVRTLERLQQVFNVSSMNTMKCRLETIAKQQGMGFHVTEATCYMTADLFYLEVVLLTCGGVDEVKVAPHGGSPAPSESLLHLLRLKHFSEFSEKLAGLFHQYDIPGDNEVKLKLFVSLQCLGKDLEQMAHLPREPKHSDPNVDMINYGRVGCVIAGKEDRPLTMQFYVKVTDEPKATDSQTDPKSVIQAAQVTVGVSDLAHSIQTSSVISQPPQLDPRGSPVFLSEAPCEKLSACFLLQLQPAIPMLVSFVNKMSQITEVKVPDVDLQWAPLPKLLMRRSQPTNSSEHTLDEHDAAFTVCLPGGVKHRYVLPGCAWGGLVHRAAIVESVPFTHPGHVPALLELLRHQCTINTLLRSCLTPQEEDATVLVCDLHLEVLPESETSFSVTFSRPDTDALAVLLVNVPNAHQISCTLFGAGIESPTMDEHLSNVMKRYMSIPTTLSTLYSKLQEMTTAPLSPSAMETTAAENEAQAPSITAVTDTTAGPSHNASVPEDGPSVNGSACRTVSVSQSELLTEINSSPVVDPYPLPPVGVLLMTNNNGHPPELI